MSRLVKAMYQCDLCTTEVTADRTKQPEGWKRLALIAPLEAAYEPETTTQLDLCRYCVNSLDDWLDSRDGAEASDG